MVNSIAKIYTASFYRFNFFMVASSQRMAAPRGTALKFSEDSMYLGALLDFLEVVALPELVVRVVQAVPVILGDFSEVLQFVP